MSQGRVFAVKQSWSWREILAALERLHPDYAMPDVPAPAEPALPTQFDLTRQRRLGVEPRGLDAILEGALEELRGRGVI